jgi:pimeloyl-ACP methyl ester carboxylesterase
MYATLSAESLSLQVHDGVTGDCAPAEHTLAHRARALHFGDLQQPLFGWWHAATNPSSLAVVVCAPFGIEELSAYRSLRYLAATLAAAGIPTLRFDYAGCGDSAGDNEDGDRVPAWLSSVNAAADVARSMSGAAHVAFVGVRLGALFAAAVAAQRSDVHALVALAPPASGQAFVRECRIRMLGVSARADSARSDGGTQAAGFVLNGATCQGLSQMAPLKTERPLVPHALLIEREDLRPGPWAKQLAESGTQVRQHILDGFKGMVDSAYRAVIPTAMLNGIAQWLQQCQPVLAACTPRCSSVANTMPVAEFDVAGEGRVRERAVYIRSDSVLSGLLAEPANAAAEMSEGKVRRAVLILNTAGERRVGPSRLWVSFARTRAARGDLVLRLDQSGVGESDVRAQTENENPYSGDVQRDIAAAIAWLRQRHGVTHCSVVGLCSGAYHGLQAALPGMQGVDHVVAINPLLFYWHPGMSLEDTTSNPGGQLAHMANATRGLRDPKKWLRLVRGELDLGGLMRVLLARTKRRLHFPLRDLARLVGVPLKQDLAADLQSMSRRGVSVQLVFSQGDPGLTVMKEEVGRAYRRLLLNGKIGLSEVADADHSFISAPARARLYAELHRLMDGVELISTLPAASPAQETKGAFLEDFEDDLIESI